MCHLVADHSIEVQKMSYSILHTAAQKRTEYLVIEAGVETEAATPATIPPELLDIVQRHINLVSLEDEDEQQVSVLSYANHGQTERFAFRPCLVLYLAGCSSLISSRAQ